MIVTLRTIDEEYENDVILELGSRLGISYSRSLESSLNIVVNGHSVSILQASLGVIAISGVVWDSSLVLLDFISQLVLSPFVKFESTSSVIDELNRRNLSFGDMKSVLDVGCGTGVVGISLSIALGRNDVVLTDCYDCCSDNIPLSMVNPSSGSLRFIQYDWTNLVIPEELTQDWDIICCSDILYEHKFHSSLLTFLSKLAFKVMIFSLKQRHFQHEKRFFEELRKWCHVMSVVPDCIELQNLPRTALSGLIIVIAIRIK